SAVKSPSWTAPASAPPSAVCKVKVTLDDGRGGSTTGQLGINLGLPQSPSMPPVVDELYQSTDTVAVNGTVDLVVSAHDPEGEALTFTWSIDSGTLGTPVTSASRSEVIWTAPSLGISSTITLVIQDASGQKTTQTFPINLLGGTVTCVKTVTSYLKKVNPYTSPLTVNYKMVGGAGGGSGLGRGGNGTIATGSFTLGAGNLEVFVGGGGGFGYHTTGHNGGGGVGYYGGGGGGVSPGGAGGGGGGGSSAILAAGNLIAFASGGGGGWGAGGGSNVGGAGGFNNTGAVGTLGAGGHGGSARGGAGLNGGAGGTNSGGGGGYGGGGGGWGGAGGTSGGTGGGLGANTWSAATDLPVEAGAASTDGGNAGLVILTYVAPTCML
ncbi:MAG TPA: hypothetical protein VFZ09_07850, partial [Archangium sp.]|nr:hypothetical protein [Archangium sp.]